ncbi:hypothetical protein EAG_03707 [Camponotus floridanus]|uniref:Uncharacterized protein n=1 Tax=Camponotus floridanus TaxID=104421 RepID=E2AVR3_CAMFO|nr:hypothetical protein EAG_03707 [Camponotus floridanus]
MRGEDQRLFFDVWNQGKIDAWNEPKDTSYSQGDTFRLYGNLRRAFRSIFDSHKNAATLNSTSAVIPAESTSLYLSLERHRPAKDGRRALVIVPGEPPKLKRTLTPDHARRDTASTNEDEKATTTATTMIENDLTDDGRADSMRDEPDDRRVASGRRGESRPTKCAQIILIFKDVLYNPSKK